MIETFPVEQVAAEALGAPRADPERCSAVAIAALGKAAGPRFALSSLSLEMAAGKVGETTELRVRVDKRTRAVAFVACEAWSDGALVFAARALFTKSE